MCSTVFRSSSTSIIPIFASLIGTLALSAAGASVGGYCSYLPGHGGAYNFSALTALPGATVGAVLAPTAFQLAKPAFGAVRSHGLRVASTQLPTLLRHGALTAGPTAIAAIAAIAGAIAVGSLTYEANRGDYVDFSGLTASPGALAGALVGPALLTGAKMALGPAGGAAAYVVSAALVLVLRRG